MRFEEYKRLVLSDLYRTSGSMTFRSLLGQVFLGESYKYIFWMRTCRFIRKSLFLRIAVANRFLKRYRYKFGIAIECTAEIGPGLQISNFGNIIVNGKARIGKNCTISQGVTVGQANRGRNKGYPVIGDNVYLGPGAKIVGAVTIGNNAAIGANCVVTRDVPENAVVVGVPGRVISYNGSEGYVLRTDYEI